MAGVPAIGSADSKDSKDRLHHERHRVAAREHGRQNARFKAHEHKWKRWKHTKGDLAPDVPELDPGMAGTGVALLAAATALLLERRRVARA